MNRSHPLTALVLARLFVDEAWTANGPGRRTSKPEDTSGPGVSLAAVLLGVLTLVGLARALIFG